jgi:hypothetical protein
MERLGLGETHVADARTIDDFDDDYLSAFEVDDLTFREFDFALVDMGLVLRCIGGFDVDHVDLFHVRRAYVTTH